MWDFTATKFRVVTLLDFTLLASTKRYTHTYRLIKCTDLAKTNIFLTQKYLWYYWYCNALTKAINNGSLNMLGMLKKRACVMVVLCEVENDWMLSASVMMLYFSLSCFHQITQILHNWATHFFQHAYIVQVTLKWHYWNITQYCTIALTDNKWCPVTDQLPGNE